MRFEIYEHSRSKEAVPSSFQEEVSEIISGVKLRKPIKTSNIRESLLKSLHHKGWSDKIRVDPHNSKIDITSTRSNVGLCIQTGNISRFYADMLKHQTLYAEGRIKGSICIVPKRLFARSFGQNIANYERLIKELKIFSKTITIPILLYGIEE